MCKTEKEQKNILYDKFQKMYNARMSESKIRRNRLNLLHWFMEHYREYLNIPLEEINFLQMLLRAIEELKIKVRLTSYEN